MCESECKVEDGPKPHRRLLVFAAVFLHALVKVKERGDEREEHRDGAAASSDIVGNDSSGDG